MNKYDRRSRKNVLAVQILKKCILYKNHVTSNGEKKKKKANDLKAAFFVGLKSSVSWLDPDQLLDDWGSSQTTHLSRTARNSFYFDWKPQWAPLKNPELLLYSFELFVLNVEERTHSLYRFAFPSKLTLAKSALIMRQYKPPFNKM